MPRKPKPVPPDFRRAVTVEKLGFTRLKKRYRVGTKTVQAWLKQCRLKTAHTPNASLQEINRKRNEPSLAQLLIETMYGSNRAHAQTLAPKTQALPRRSGAHAQRFQALDQKSKAHAQKPRAQPCTNNSAFAQLSDEDVYRMFRKSAKKVNFAAKWPRYRIEFKWYNLCFNTPAARESFANEVINWAKIHWPVSYARIAERAARNWQDDPTKFDVDHPDLLMYVVALVVDHISDRENAKA